MPPAPLSPTQLDAFLPLVLGQNLHTPAQVKRAIAGFHDYVHEGGITWEGRFCGPETAPSAVVIALLLPGKTAIILPADPAVAHIDPAAQRDLTRSLLAELAPRGLHYAQALLEPTATGPRDLLKSVGFCPLAPLVYLERDARFPWVDPPDDDAGHWVPYNEQTRAAFAETVLATYVGSADCPELTGLRPIEDILAAHRASGVFDPELWELIEVDGQPVGCLLLGMLARGALLEIVYMGVVAEWRRRGIGQLLIRRAIAHCRTSTAQRLSVVSDGRNAAAVRLYERFAFTPVTRREALLYRWPGS